MRSAERTRAHNVQILIRFEELDGPVEQFLSDLPPNPHSAQNVGSRDQAQNIPRSNYISYRSISQQWDDGFDAHWAFINNTFKDYRAGAISTAKHCGRVLITVVIDHAGRFPALYFERAFLDFIESLGAELEIDVLDSR